MRGLQEREREASVHNLLPLQSSLADVPEGGSQLIPSSRSQEALDAMETRDILHEDFELLVGIEDTQEKSAKVSYEETQFSDTEKSLQGRQEEISLENITKRSSQASILQDEPASTTDDICLNDDVNKTTTAATKHTAAPPSNSGGELYNDTNSISQSSGKELADSDTSVREKIMGKDGNRFQELAEELEKKVEQNQEDIHIDHANLYMIKQALEDYGPEHESLPRGNFLDMLPKGEKRNVSAEEYPLTEDTSTGSSVKTIEDVRNQKAPEHMNNEIRMETENKEEENPTRENDGGKERRSKKTESKQNVPSRDKIEDYKQKEEHDIENKDNEQKNTNIESRVFEIDHLPVLEHTETKELPRTQLLITENSTVGLTLEVDREKENPEAGTSGNIIAYKDILLQDNKVPGREVGGAIISGSMVNISTNNEFQWTDTKQIDEHESLDTGCRELENYKDREYETTQSTTGSKNYNTQAEELDKSIDLNEISHGVIQTIEATEGQISNKIFGDQGYEEPDRKSKSTGNQVPMDEEDSDNLLLHQTLTMHHLERSKMNPEIHTEKQHSGLENTNENAEMISENSEATSKIKQVDDTEISRSNKKDEALKQQDRTDDMLSAIQKNNVEDDENENFISRRLIKKMAYAHSNNIDNRTESSTNDSEYIHEEKEERKDLFTQAEKTELMQQTKDPKTENCNKENELSDGNNDKLPHEAVSDSSNTTDLFGDDSSVMEYKNAGDNQNTVSCQQKLRMDVVETLDEIPDAENFINKVETKHPAEWPTNANEPSNPFVNKGFGLKDSDLVTSEKDADKLNNEIAAHLPATEKEMDKNTETSDEAKKPATNLEEPEMLGKLDIGEKRNILQSEQKHDKDIEITKEEVQQANTESVDQTSSSINPKKMVKLSENKFKGPTDKPNEDIDPIHIKDKGYNIEEFIEETQTKIEMERPEVKEEDNWNKSHNTGEMEVSSKVCDMFGTTHDFIGLSDASDRNITDQHTGFVGVDDIVKHESTYTVNSHIQQAQILEAENFISKIETEHPAECPTNANKLSNPVVNKEGFRPKDSNLMSSEHNVKKQNNEIAAHLPEKEKQTDKSTEISHEAKPASELEEEPERLVKLYSAEKSNILQPEERCDKDIEITNEEVQQDNRESDDQTSSASDTKKMVKHSEHKVEGATEKPSEDVDIIHIEDKGSNIEEFTEASQTNIVIEQPEVNDEDNSNKSLNAPEIEVLCKDINMFDKTKDLTALSDASDRNIPDQRTGFVGVGEDEIVKQESTNTVGGHTQQYQTLDAKNFIYKVQTEHPAEWKINTDEPCNPVVNKEGFKPKDSELVTSDQDVEKKNDEIAAQLAETEKWTDKNKEISKETEPATNLEEESEILRKPVSQEWSNIVQAEESSHKDIEITKEEVHQTNSESEDQTSSVIDPTKMVECSALKVEGPVEKPNEDADIMQIQDEGCNVEEFVEATQTKIPMEEQEVNDGDKSNKIHNTLKIEVLSKDIDMFSTRHDSIESPKASGRNTGFVGEDDIAKKESTYTINSHTQEDQRCPQKIEDAHPAKECPDVDAPFDPVFEKEGYKPTEPTDLVAFKEDTEKRNNETAAELAQIEKRMEANKKESNEENKKATGSEVASEMFGEPVIKEKSHFEQPENICNEDFEITNKENQESYRGSREKNKFDSSFKVLDTEESKNETQNVNLTIVDIYKEQAAGNVTRGSPEKFYRETQSFTAEKLHDHQLVREEDQREISGLGEKVEEQVGLVNLADRKGEETQSNDSVKSKDKQVNEGHYMPLEQNVERKYVIEDRESSIAKDVELRNHHVIFTETKEGFGTLEAAKEQESTSIEETYMPSDVAHGVNIPDKKDEHAESGTECAEASASPTELIKLESLISNLVINDLQDKIDNKESLSTLRNSSFVSRVSQLQEERENEKKNGDASQLSHVQHVDETYVSLLKTGEKDKETYPITTNQASKEVLHVPEDDATQSEDLQNDQRIEELPVSQFLMNQILLGDSLEDDAIPHVNAEIHEDTDSRLKNMSIPEKGGVTGLIFGNILTNDTSISNNNIESLTITEKYSGFPLKQETSNVMYKVDDREADTEIHEKQHESLLSAKEVDENPNNEEISQSSYLELNDGLKSRNEMEEGIELDHLKASSPENVAPSSLTPVDEMKVEPYTAENNIRTLEKNEIDVQASLEQKMSNPRNEVKDGQVDTAIEEKDVGNQHCTEEANKSGEDEKSSYTVSKESEGSGERNDPKPSAIEPSNPEANVAKEIILFEQESAEPDCSTIVNTADIEVSAMGNSLISNLDVTTKLLDEEILVSKDGENVMETTEEKPNEDILEKKLIEIERTVVIESPISTARGEQYSEEKEEAMENVSYKPGGDPPSSSVENKQKVDVRGDNSEKENTGVKEDEQAETEKNFITDNTVSSDNAREAQIQELQPAVSEQLVLAMPAVSENILEKEVTTEKTKTLGKPRDASSVEKESVQVRDKNIIAEGKTEDDDAESILMEEIKGPNQKQQKKHHGLLSGVGSKVKHSIINKVKKAITCTTVQLPK